jgi:hypothetical protein
MMKRADRLAIPLLAGSTLATCWRRPNLEYDLGEHELAEACCLCNGGVSFGFGGESTIAVLVLSLSYMRLSRAYLGKPSFFMHMYDENSIAAVFLQVTGGTRWKECSACSSGAKGARRVWRRCATWRATRCVYTTSL